jgi:hypothetical protein
MVAWRSPALITTLACSLLAACDRKPAKPSGQPIGIDQVVLLDKDVVYVVEGANISVINRGRGMTIESEGGHKIYATLDVEHDGSRASLRLIGWDPQDFAGHSFVIAGIGEKHGGTDVKIRVTKR